MRMETDNKRRKSTKIVIEGHAFFIGVLSPQIHVE